MEEIIIDTKPFTRRLSQKKRKVLLFLALSSLLFAGCSQEAAGDSVEENTTAIEIVLEQEFTGPDEEVIQLKEEMNERLTDKLKGNSEESIVTLSAEDPEQQNYLSYLENIYASNFTEKAFNDFSKTYAFSYHQPGDSYKLEIAGMEIIQSENAAMNYRFTVYVDYQNPSGETTQYEIGGNTVTTEEGKIGKIDFNDKDGLSQQIAKDTHE